MTRMLLACLLLLTLLAFPVAVPGCRRNSNTPVDAAPSKLDLKSLFDEALPIEYIYCPVDGNGNAGSVSSPLPVRRVILRPAEERYAVLFSILRELELWSHDKDSKASFNVFLDKEIDYSQPSADGALLRQQRNGKLVQIHIAGELIIRKGDNGALTCYADHLHGEDNRNLGLVLLLLRPGRTNTSQAVSVPPSPPATMPSVAGRTGCNVASLFDKTKPIEYIYRSATTGSCTSRASDNPRPMGSIVLQPGEERYQEVFWLLGGIRTQIQDQSGDSFRKEQEKTASDYSQLNEGAALLRQQQSGESVQVYVDDELLVYNGENGAKACRCINRPSMGQCLSLLRFRE